MGVIYKITNTVNNKVYIGKTIRSFEERKQEHLTDYLSKDYKIYRAMRKYGVENFIFEIIEKDINDKKELSQKERDYIQKYNSYYKGYNATFGGEGESCVDEQKIINLFLEGKNCKDIESITNHTTKTISSILKRNGFQVPNHLGKNSLNKNNTEIKVIYLNKEYSSISELAIFLKENEEEFFEKRKATIIQGISKSLKNNSSYLNRKFYYSS